MQDNLAKQTDQPVTQVPPEPPPGIPGEKPEEIPTQAPPPPPPSRPLPEEPPLVISTPPPKKSRVKVILNSIVLLILLISIPAGVYLVQRIQEIRKEAAEEAILLGRVVDTSSRYSSCYEQRFFYGDNCGNDQCHGLPNYSVTWTQDGRSQTIDNNDCYPQGQKNLPEPRYTFEWTKNPVGDPDGEKVDVSISMSTPFLGPMPIKVPLQEWFLVTTDSNGNELPGSYQSGTFAIPGPEQSLTVRVYKKGDYKWNHLWFIAYTPTPTPTPTPTVTPAPGITTTPAPRPTATPTPPSPTATSTPIPFINAQCQQIKAYDLSWNPLTIIQLSQLKAGDNVIFAVLGKTNVATFDKARFRVNSSEWIETTAKKPMIDEFYEEFYIKYTIPTDVTSFKVEAEVHHPNLGWL